jgi:hypothetical protein
VRRESCLGAKVVGNAKVLGHLVEWKIPRIKVKVRERVCNLLRAESRLVGHHNHKENLVNGILVGTAIYGY